MNYSCLIFQSIFSSLLITVISLDMAVSSYTYQPKIDYPFFIKQFLFLDDVKAEELSSNIYNLEQIKKLPKLQRIESSKLGNFKFKVLENTDDLHFWGN